MLNKSKIFAALQSLNHIYGKGELIESSLTDTTIDRHIPMTASTYGPKQSLKWRIKGNSVHFLGHQRKIEG
jgi:hypothetical protein